MYYKELIKKQNKLKTPYSSRGDKLNNYYK